MGEVCRKKTALDVRQWNVYIPIGQLMSEVCRSEVEEKQGGRDASLLAITSLSSHRSFNSNEVQSKTD